MPAKDWTASTDRDQDLRPAGSHWVLAGPRRPIIAVGLDPLADYVRLFVADWPCESVQSTPPRPPDVVVRSARGGHSVFCRAVPEEPYPSSDPLDAARFVVGALICAYLSQVGDGLAIHAAASEFGAGVALLIGRSEAGKSSLGLHLAAAGHRLYGDDQVILRIGGGRASATVTCLGVNPKVRLPLPDDCGSGYRHFVEGRTIFRNETLALLRLEEERAARFGEEREVAALIALDRGPGGEALLAPAAPSTVLRKVLECGSSIRLKADALLTGLGKLANSVPGYALRYSSSAEAARLVERKLGVAGPG